MRHINQSAKIEGLVRKERYELPPGAIREMIVNAQVHRNYMDSSSIQVAVYDDRLEISSPGSLYGGLTLQEIICGKSKIRNKVIAEIFNKMDLIEQWGTGIQRIINRAKEYGLPKPEFMEIGETFRVNLYRKKADKKPIKVNRENLIMAYIKENGSISNMEARQILNLAESTTKRFLKNMVNEGLLLEKGERKSRIYVLTAEE